MYGSKPASVGTQTTVLGKLKSATEHLVLKFDAKSKISRKNVDQQIKPSFFNLAKQLDHAEGSKILGTDARWKYVGQSILKGAGAGAAVGGAIGLCFSASFLFLDGGLCALTGLWKGALIGGAAAALVSPFNYKKVLENNLSKHLSQNKASFSPATQSLITNLEKAIENRGSGLKELWQFNFKGAWHKMRDTEYKEAAYKLSHDNTQAAFEMKISFEAIKTARVANTVQ